MTTEIIKALQKRHDAAKRFRDQACDENNLQLEREWQARSEAYANAINIVFELSIAPSTLFI